VNEDGAVVVRRNVMETVRRMESMDSTARTFRSFGTFRRTVTKSRHNSTMKDQKQGMRFGDDADLTGPKVAALGTMHGDKVRSKPT
jgi:hypothetical protein